MEVEASSYRCADCFESQPQVVPERGAVRLILCEVLTYPCVTWIDFMEAACGIVEICLKDVLYYSMLGIAGS